MKNFIWNEYGEKLAIVNTEKNQNLWTNNKVIGNKNAICLHFLPYLLNVYRKFDF